MLAKQALVALERETEAQAPGGIVTDSAGAY